MGEVRRGSRLNTPELSCKVMMNLWLFNGGGFGGHEGYNNRYPMTVQYEYFRFYKWDQETKYPCDGFGPDCLEEDDHYLAANNPCDGIEQKGLLMGQRPCYVHGRVKRPVLYRCVLKEKTKPKGNVSWYCHNEKHHCRCVDQAIMDWHTDKFCRRKGDNCK